MKRIRIDNDGTSTTFRPEKPDGPYRVEIEVSSADELRSLKRDGRLVAVRMHGTPSGKATQYSLIPVGEIQDFSW